LFALGLSIGCGGSEAPAPAATTQLGAQSPLPSDPAARVVYQFLDAVRRGNSDGAASQMLTPLALQHITQRNMNISPPGSATARFQIGRVAQLDGDRAIVESLWTDVDADGKPYEEPIVCALRLCDGQWRIYGMAEDRGPNQPPMVMDFENLETVAPRKPQTAPGAGPAAAPSPTPREQMAQDPFQPPRR
jgi:hypothetical protein